jgi:hypothetical protein
LRAFENREDLLKRIFRPKRDEVEGGWRKLYNVVVPYFHPSPDIIRVIKSRGWDGRGMQQAWGR